MQIKILNIRFKIIISKPIFNINYKLNLIYIKLTICYLKIKYSSKY